ncbi:MAG: hypothetical protein PHC39_04550 [Proteiniphilum sp.]|nr:hypothetical protein [Proteiniphilum sp.]
MSKLHDLKKGIASLPQRMADKALEKTINYAIPKMEAFENEDPEKVQAFLADLATDMSFPPEVRAAGKKLLDQYKLKKKPLNEVIHAGITESVKKLEDKINVSIEQ